MSFTAVCARCTSHFPVNRAVDGRGDLCAVCARYHAPTCRLEGCGGCVLVSTATPFGHAVGCAGGHEPGPFCFAESNPLSDALAAKYGPGTQATSCGNCSAPALPTHESCIACGISFTGRPPKAPQFFSKGVAESLRVAAATTRENCVDCHASARVGGGACPRHAEPGQSFNTRRDCKPCGCSRNMGCGHDPRQSAYGALSPETSAAAKLVAEKDKEIADLKAEVKMLRDRDAAVLAAAADRTRKRLDREDAARALIARARPILADLARDPDVAKLCRDIRDFLSPAPPAEKRKPAADVVLAKAFGVVTAVDHEKKRITIEDVPAPQFPPGFVDACREDIRSACREVGIDPDTFYRAP